ncbi:MAG: M2 family metallopeptidase [Myxococcota bacterium]|nr:M2 family metallopeptidase [Myxococcota bacterium]
MNVRIIVRLAVLCGACGANSRQPVGVGAASPLSATPQSDACATAARDRPATVHEASAFVADVEAHLRELWVARDRASWINQNFITDDTQAGAAAAEQATAEYVDDVIKQSRRFEPLRDELPADIARKLHLLAIAQTIPAPNDAGERAELAGIETWMTSTYGKGQYCPPAGSRLRAHRSSPATPAPACLRLDDLSRVLATSHDYDELLEAWTGWHSVAPPMKERYARYVELANKGAREIGFDDVGALWRAGYDMSPASFEADVERLWSDVKPLYDDLHCYVRSKLQTKYGKTKIPDRAPIPAQLLGNMWAQDWSNLYDSLAPYPGEATLDVGTRLRSQHWDPVKMVREGERFFTSLGFDPLPSSFWQRSLLTRPRDREVVCHASAWDVTWSGDLRIKMCIEPTEEDFVTIHHELGHDFYFQRYVNLPILFQQGANDGFHEAIGDTMALSVTPEYSERLGLLKGVIADRRNANEAVVDRARMNHQMKMALDKVAFLPFGLLEDKWRWDVFSGKISPVEYNAAWWRLRRRYQGVIAPIERSPQDFDAGAKFHVASSTPYVRYFLARIYQFSFHKALCRAAGVTGPLDQCSIHDSKDAGAKLKEMLSLGASKPWPDAMEALGAGRRADATALLEYFAPLRKWLSEQNDGRSCGWE